MNNEELSIETRASKSGINADQVMKQEAKYDSSKGDEAEARFWMEAVAGEPIEGEFFSFLRDGSYLCRLLNKIQPGLVPSKFETPATQKFKSLDAIQKFLDGCREYGMKQDDLFTTLDLYEETDRNMVLSGIIALGRTAQKNDFEGPTLGPKESEANERDFPLEVQEEANKVVSLQYGSNKGASTAGMTAYGTPRQVYDPAI